MRICLIAAVAVLAAGAAPAWAQSNQQTVIDAAVDNDCTLSREDARRSLRGSGMTPQDVRAVVRDLVAAGRGRVSNGTFYYEDGPCAGSASTRKEPRPAPAQEESAAAEAPAEETATETPATGMSAGTEPEDRMNDMVALIRANDCQMTDAEAQVVFTAARLSYIEIATYLSELVADGDARFDGRTVLLSTDLCEAAN